jgi:ligand-binding SRPBCC domain-containing protein
MTAAPATLLRQLWIPRPLEVVFSFFSNPQNLEQLTPPSIGFKILTPEPISMQAGTLLDYRILLHGFPLRWRSEITAWEPPHRFVDVQRRGPYSSWLHEHRFESRDHGTLLTDFIQYQIPFHWVPGAQLLRRFLVEPDLHRIFEFRRTALLRHFGLRETDCVPPSPSQNPTPPTA